jgi:hypothetical protein
LGSTAHASSTGLAVYQAVQTNKATLGSRQNLIQFQFTKKQKHYLCFGVPTSFFPWTKKSFPLEPKKHEIPPGTILKINSPLSLYLTIPTQK